MNYFPTGRNWSGTGTFLIWCQTSLGRSRYFGSWLYDSIVVFCIENGLSEIFACWTTKIGQQLLGYFVVDPLCFVNRQYHYSSSIWAIGRSPIEVSDTLKLAVWILGFRNWSNTFIFPESFKCGEQAVKEVDSIPWRVSSWNDFVLLHLRLSNQASCRLTV